MEFALTLGKFQFASGFLIYGVFQNSSFVTLGGSQVGVCTVQVSQSLRSQEVVEC